MRSAWEIRTKLWLGFNIHLGERCLSSSVLKMQAKLVYLVFIVSNNKWILLILCIHIFGLANTKPKIMYMSIIDFGRLLVCTHIISFLSALQFTELFIILNLMQKLAALLELCIEQAHIKDVLFLSFRSCLFMVLLSLKYFLLHPSNYLLPKRYRLGKLLLCHCNNNNNLDA